MPRTTRFALRRRSAYGLFLLLSHALVGTASGAPSIVYDYSERRSEPYISIKSINGVVDLVPMPEENCYPVIESGRIEQVTTGNDSLAAASFRLRRSDGFADDVNLAQLQDAKLSMVDIAWLGKFFAVNRRVLVSGMRCGASGHEFVARDIFDADFIEHLVHPRRK